MKTAQRRTQKNTIGARLKASMRNNYMLFRQDPFVAYSFVSSIVLIIVTLLFLFINASHLPSSVPLYYSLPWGEERLVPTTYLLLIPGISFGFFLFNLLWMVILYKSFQVLSRILIVMSVCVIILNLYTLIRIVLLIL